MKNLTTHTLARPIIIRLNTVDVTRSQWAQIVDAKSGKVLHTGQCCYIRRIARQRYNVRVRL